MATTTSLDSFARAAAVFAILLAASPSRADSCSASTSAVVSRSTGGNCAVALAPDQVFTLTYRIANASIVDGGPNDGQQVSAILVAGTKIDAVLAQTTSDAGSPELPGILAFVPVCPAGSAGGTKAAGEECDPDLSECGPGFTCGCESALPGVTCTDGIAANKVALNITQEIAMGPGQLRTVASLRVKRLTGSAPPVNCGEFFSHMHSAEDLLQVDDPLCESPVTAGAQASADLHAPECFVDTDCGDTECNECAEVGTNSHCAPRNIGGPCGTDDNASDCLTPACVDNAGQGECQQAQNVVAEDTSCTNNGGVPVPAVECQVPLCDAGGTCTNAPDPAQDGDPCGTDANLQDCLAPACLAGGCAQEQNPVGAGASCTNNGGIPVPAVECEIPLCDAGGVCANVPDPAQDGNPCADTDASNCYVARCAAGGCNQLAVCDPTENPAVCRVTISDYIWSDDNADGVQDAGETGIAGVDVDVFSCSGGVPSVQQGTATTNGSGLYTFSMPTCNPSETLAIDVSGSFSGALAGFTESPAFCNANNPSVCGAEVTPALDSNCIDGVSDCRSIVLGSEDPTVDCGYSLCGNGVVNPGEVCDAPGAEICNNKIDDDGDTIVDCDDPDCPVGYQSCNENCQLAAPCRPVQRDPATLSWERFRMHGYFIPTTAVDPLLDGFVILITNEDGEVYRGELLAGDLKLRGNGDTRKSWRFRDRDARSGNGIRGGISRVSVRKRREANGETAFPFHIDVYGDMSRATLARMTVQVYLNDDVGFVTATWLGEPGRWYLPLKQFQAGLVAE